MNMRGTLFVVAAPSGAGKSSIVNAVLARDPQIRLSISFTSRAARPGERHAQHYHFVSADEFQRMIEAGDFFEHARVHGDWKGTARQSVEPQLAAGHDVLLEIDWQGALQIQKLFPDAILVFVLPPSWEELRSRLTRRGEDAPDVIELRLANAREELAQAQHFDFVIINEVFERALFDLKTIVHAQRLRYIAQKSARADTFQALGIA